MEKFKVHNHRWLAVAAILIMLISTSAKLKKAEPRSCPGKFFERMGDLPGCEVTSSPNDISADGKKVVGASSADEPPPIGPNDCTTGHLNEAAGWTSSCRFDPPFYPGGKKGLVGLGYLPSPSQNSYAYGISPDGLVTVGWSDVALSTNHPVVFLPSGVRELALMHLIGIAADISDKNVNKVTVKGNWGTDGEVMNGRIIVGYSSSGGNHPHRVPGAHAVYWNSYTNIVLLPVPAILPNGKVIVSSEATCISDDGMTIGGALYYSLRGASGDYRSYPCAWNFSGGSYYMQVLADLAGGDINARITHISGNGKVLVGWGTPFAGDSTCNAYPEYACKWTYNPGLNKWGTPKILDPLAGGYKYSVATGINFNGEVVVGGSYNYDPALCPYPDFNSRATLWRGASPPVDLQLLLSPMVPEGLQLWEAMSVSADGRIVTGYSFDPDFVMEGWTAGL